MRPLYRRRVLRLVSLCRFTYVADAVVYICFPSEIASCRPVADAMVLRSHAGLIRCAEIVVSDTDPWLPFVASTCATRLGRAGASLRRPMRHVRIQ